MMKTKMKSQNNGYQIRTNQKAGLTCEGYMELLDSHIQQCVQNPRACEGIAHAIKCMDSACENTPIPCFR
jgi:hypothetical protein